MNLPTSVSGGGQIDREYALGKGALDLLARWGLPSGETQSIAIELKIRRDTDTEQEAVEQLVEYLDVLGLNEGWLVLFDLRKTLSWEEKIIRRDIVDQGKAIHLVGC